jgi:hypothetical protein
MSTEAQPPEGEQPKDDGKQEEQRVPYERFQQVNQQAKDAKEKAAKLESDLADIRSQMEEREQQGLPELDQLRKRLEKAEQRAEQAEQEREKALGEAANVRRERWVTAAAAAQNFIDPDDAVRYVDLSEVESIEDAERAVKRVAKQKQHLIRDEEPKLPGRVLRDGQREKQDRPRGGIDREAEAEQVGQALQQFLKSRSSTSIGG